MINKLKTKINNCTSTIGVIGLGYVGLPIVLRFNESGFNVIGFDVDKKKIANLKTGESYIKHISDSEIKNYKKRISFTSNFKKISICDVIILAYQHL